MKLESKIWIELPTPRTPEAALQNCQEANRMMARLGAKEDVFSWDQDSQQYLRLLPGGAGFYYLKDNGDWFNLAKLSASWT